MIITGAKKKAMGKSKRVPLMLWLLALLGAALLAGCYIPGLSNLGDAGDPPAAGDPGGVDETLYGKFFIYQVADGKLSTLIDPADAPLNRTKIDYIVGETYFPPNDYVKEGNINYNIMHTPDGHYEPPYDLIYGYTVPDMNIFYREAGSGPPASSRPEGIVLNGQLSLFYTNYQSIGVNNNPEISCIPDDGFDLADGTTSTPGYIQPPNPAFSQQLRPTNYYIARFSNSGAGDMDSDIYYLDIAWGTSVEPGTFVIFRLFFNTMLGDHAKETGPNLAAFHEPKLSLYDGNGRLMRHVMTGAPISSKYGPDMFQWRDPVLSHYFQNPGRYYLKVETLKDTACDSSDNGYRSTYFLLVESPGKHWSLNRIMKGEIQKARSGSTDFYLQGGPSFEPDDMATEVKDEWPDCDGIPGSGDEGDWGIYEQCESYINWGAQDGAMQYQEVDNKAGIDDGEYFNGRPTNVGSALDSEVSIITNPARASLLMFINYGSRIYMLESLDGHVGLQWDLSNLLYDRPSIVPRKERGQGSVTAPVISSGPLGFCETVPQGDDWWAAPELNASSDYPGETFVSNTGVATRVPRGYPDTIAITFGDNQHLDSKALVDTQWGNVITSGPDGIINTFFAPRYIAYGYKPLALCNPIEYRPPAVMPQTASEMRSFGPGTPDNPWIYDFTVDAMVQPLASLGGSNASAFLLGTDLWNPAVFDANTNSPAAYWQKQHCNFYSLAENFDRCAMGVPKDGYGQEPAAILSGGNGLLDTAYSVLYPYRGGDYLCLDGTTSTAAICPGPSGKFGWSDIYIPLKGDDRLWRVYDPPHTAGDYAGSIDSPYWPAFVFGATADIPMGGVYKVGIDPGPDGVLQTMIIDSYTLVDLEDFKIIIGGDHYCQRENGTGVAICPGAELEVDLYLPYVNQVVRESRRLMSDWTMYLNNPDKIEVEVNDAAPLKLQSVNLIKRDLYDRYDDYFCLVNNRPAICPGENGFFQSYPLNEKVVVANDEDLFNLYQRVSNMVGQPCYELKAEKVQNTPAEDPKTVYFLYRYLGVRMDDKIKFDLAKGGFYVTTGPNGINQSCAAGNDPIWIPYHQGLPNQTIIVPAPGQPLNTYPLADELITYTAGVKKISTSDDGIANSYVQGDDRMEIFMGTGKPDHPCVLAGWNGKADTTAQSYLTDASLPLSANDTQLYEPGEITGFDAFHVGSADAVRLGSSVYLYYTGLGWETLPEQGRDGAGALAARGECTRAGLDYEWGEKDVSPKYLKDNIYPYEYDRRLDLFDFPYALDNNEGVALAPRIGVAISTLTRLMANPGDWTYYDKPAVDVGRICAGAVDFPIEGLDLELPGLAADFHWNGAYSPDAVMTTAENEDDSLFILFFTGLSDAENQDPNIVTNASKIGLARSLDGVNWEVLRDVNPLVTIKDFNLDFLLGAGAVNYGNPTVVGAGEDEYGEPMFGMFFNKYELDFPGEKTTLSLRPVDRRTKDFIGYALRKGKISPSSCTIGANPMTTSQDRLRGALQLLIIVVPALLVMTVRLFRRSQA
jgi:hypothetical protein